ncbi:hypothetical protein OROGR_001203 [Orobanche gracilis]
MMNIPVRFKRVAAAFEEMARVCSCESSGSEHSEDLSDLVNSFFEREIRDLKANDEEVDDLADVAGVHDEIIEDGETDCQISNSPHQIELRDSLKRLIDSESDAARKSIRVEAEAALEEVSGEEDSPQEFKRRLMARLRSRGFDAGLCKSKWEKNGRIPSGSYEYIDVNAGSGSGSRYIIEIHLAGEFTIARPSGCYASLLVDFPTIFVGQTEELKQVIRLMSKAIRKSMKSAGLNVPPWRRLAYMQAKWFGFYRRTVNETPAGKACKKSLEGNRLVGFAPVILGASTPSLYCGGDFTARNGGGIGNLAVALN